MLWAAGIARRLATALFALMQCCALHTATIAAACLPERHSAEQAGCSPDGRSGCAGLRYSLRTFGVAWAFACVVAYLHKIHPRTQGSSVVYYLS